MTVGERVPSSVALLTATADLVAERGLAGVDLAAVARRAGTSAELLAQRFGSLTELVVTVVDHVLADWVETSLAPALRSTSGLDGLLTMVGAYRELVEHRPAQATGLARLIQSASGPDPTLRARGVDLNAGVRSYVARELRTGVADGSVRPDVDADAVAGVVVSVVRGASYQWVLDPTGFAVLDVLDELRVLLRRGLTPPAPVPAVPPAA